METVTNNTPKIHMICRALSRQDGGIVTPADWRLEYQLPSGAMISHRIEYAGQSPIGADLVAALGAVADDISVTDWTLIPRFNIDGARLNGSTIGADCGMAYTEKCLAEFADA